MAELAGFPTHVVTAARTRAEERLFWGLGFRVSGFGFKASGLGFKIAGWEGLGFSLAFAWRVLGLSDGGGVGSWGLREFQGSGSLGLGHLVLRA